jgi:hypothetical protein
MIVAKIAANHQLVQPAVCFFAEAAGDEGVASGVADVFFAR